MKKITFPSAKLLLTLLSVLALNSLNAQRAYFSTNSGSVVEGGTFTFSAHLTAVSTTNTVINITSVPDTADASDYTAYAATVTIPAGQLSTGVLTIATTDDSIIEDYTEYFNVNAVVTSGNTVNASFSLYGGIIDNDRVPNLYITDLYTVNEANAASMSYQLSNPFHSDIIIQVTTTAGTATTADFTAVNTSITIPAGQRNGSFSIAITNDALVEPDESFTLTSTVTSGNTVNLSNATAITIRDNDTTPVLSFGTYDNGIPAYEGNNCSLYTYLNRPYNSDVIFQVTTTNGTAGSGDYTSTTSTRTIPAGSTYLYISIPITDDTLDEPSETFTVTATITSGNTTNTSLTSTVTIIDNDGLPDLTFSNVDNQSQIEEGEDGRIRVALAGGYSNVDTVVQLTSSNITAGNLDYTPLSMTITIPAGFNYSDSFYLTTLLDQLQEADETVLITGTVISGNTYNSSASFTITILDNYNVNAHEDEVSTISHIGGTFPLLANDTLHGLPLNPSDVTVTLGANSYGITINSLGIVSVPNTLAIGSYNLTYTVCEVANPAHCDTTTIVFQVKSPLDATYNLIYSDYNSDGYTSVGDIITFRFDITNNGNAPVSNIDVDFMYGITVTGGPIAVLNPGQTDSTTYSAIHIITQDDINFGLYDFGTNQSVEVSFAGTYYGTGVDDWAQLGSPFSLQSSDGIRLKAFVDTNGNGTQDTGEINFPLGHFNYQINNTGPIHNLYTTPYYLYESNPTTTYNLTFQVDSDYAANNTCAVSYPNVTVAPGSGITTYNFPVTVTPYQDLSVNLHNYSFLPRPGFAYYSYISYTNNSNVTVPSGTLTFTKDPAVTTVSVCDTTAVFTSTGFTYNFVNLLPYETRTFWIQFVVGTIPTVSLGQLLTNSVSITIPPGDILPSNNTSSITETIVGSYDPNEKTESHGGRIVQSSFTSNDYLTYTIKFENTGTANAINVKITDVLDNKLDETTIKMIDASHEYALERVNKTLNWNFFGIDLPPSVPNSTTGHGYIVFKIKPKPGYVIGDIIPNTANIYFDFNPAIVTEPCLTQFVQSLGNDHFAFDNFECYPNPASDYLNISNATAIDAVDITSVLGQKVKSVKVGDLNARIDLSGLSSGIYFVKITAEGQEKIIKIIKD